MRNLQRYLKMKYFMKFYHDKALGRFSLWYREKIFLKIISFLWTWENTEYWVSGYEFLPLSPLEEHRYEHWTDKSKLRHSGCHNQATQTILISYNATRIIAYHSDEKCRSWGGKIADLRKEGWTARVISFNSLSSHMLGVSGISLFKIRKKMT